MGKSTISMGHFAIFNSYFDITRGYPPKPIAACASFRRYCNDTSDGWDHPRMPKNMSGCDLPLMIRLGVRLPNMFGMIIIINQDIGICSYQLYGVKKMVYHGIYHMIMIIWGLIWEILWPSLTSWICIAGIKIAKKQGETSPINRGACTPHFP